MFSAASIGPELRPKVINISSLVLKCILNQLNTLTAVVLPLCNATGCSPHSQLTGLELRTKLINTPFLVPKEVVHILSCAFAHEAPSNSSICDPSSTHVLGCRYWTRAATQSDQHTFLGAQLDHTTRVKTLEDPLPWRVPTLAFVSIRVRVHSSDPFFLSSGFHTESSYWARLSAGP
ncbi:hypothetical protein RDI58_003249 [Solanum bulbocastanum]|uniref:Uncharacterized protein n=1 Tax=Solanum bulbocastanum TaxID=147425 RepID=A0AAN8U801_SOLBU